MISSKPISPPKERSTGIGSSQSNQLCLFGRNHPKPPRRGGDEATTPLASEIRSTFVSLVDQMHGLRTVVHIAHNAG
jgi:hypothetical protein